MSKGTQKKERTVWFSLKSLINLTQTLRPGRVLVSSLEEIVNRINLLPGIQQ